MLKSKHLLVLCFATMFIVSACASNTKKTVPMNQKPSVSKVVKNKKMIAKVNINKADIKTLKTVCGIGSKRATAIVNYRKQHGAFKNINELGKLKGKGYSFSKKYIKSIANKITV